MVNTMTLIEQLQAPPFNMIQPGSGAVMFQTSDGCYKQFKSATATWCQGYLSHRYGIEINICITCPHHGKGTVDALAGTDKYYIRCFLCVIRDDSEDDESWEQRKRKMDSFAVDKDGNQVVFAQRVVNLLSDPDRKYGAKSHMKSKKRERARVVRKRFYFVSNYRVGDKSIPLAHTNFRIVSGFDKPTYVDDDGKRKATTKNGIADHFNFITLSELPLNLVVTRRFPCSCEACHAKSLIPWDHTKNYDEQDRWKSAEDCDYAWEFEDLNDYKFLTLMPAKGDFDESEIHECLSDALEVIEHQMGERIKADHYGAVNADDPQGAPDGYYLVEWDGEPYVLQEPKEVEGCVGGPMPEGTLVVPGRYLYRVPRNPNWYHSRLWKGEEVKLFRVQYVLDPDIELERYNVKEGRIPTRGNLTAGELKTVVSRCYKVPMDTVTEIGFEKKRRSNLDYVEIEFPVEEGDNEGDDE